jgi:2-polyprenyl-3-methyl-5-hydroxy-6-metoxy-1,4-benzoquinol methylase
MPERQTLQKLHDQESRLEGGVGDGCQSCYEQTEPSLAVFSELLEKLEAELGGREILDVGCGYGTHLALAAERGWNCFGIEVSSHARSVARGRHGEQIFLMESVESLLPHRFDCILLFDVLEYLTDPAQFFYSLFAKGAIGPETRVFVTTPNARSGRAMADPARWAYRRPPLHLLYCSAESLMRLMKKLLFRDVAVSGIYPEDSSLSICYDDESSALNDSLISYSRLFAAAQGSNFYEFAHERYVRSGYLVETCGIRTCAPLSICQRLCKRRARLGLWLWLRVRSQPDRRSSRVCAGCGY